MCRRNLERRLEQLVGLHEFLVIVGVHHQQGLALLHRLPDFLDAGNADGDAHSANFADADGCARNAGCADGRIARPPSGGAGGDDVWDRAEVVSRPVFAVG